MVLFVTRTSVSITQTGPCLTKAIVLRLSLSLRKSALATEPSDAIEISLSPFLIACDASYQKWAQ